MTSMLGSSAVSTSTSPGRLDGLARLDVDISRVRAARTRQAVSEGVDLRDRSLAMQSSSVRPDVMHLSWYPPGLHRLPTRAAVAVTVYDMISERYPELSMRPSVGATAACKRAWVEASDCLFADSAHTRDDLVEVLEVDPERRDRDAPRCYGRRSGSAGRCRRRLGNSTVVLYVGDRSSPYKRFEVLLQALEDSRALDPDLRSGVLRSGSARLRARCARRPQDRRSGGFRLGRRRPSRLVVRTRSGPCLPLGLRGLRFATARGHEPSTARWWRAGVVIDPEVVGDAALLIDPGDTKAFLHDALASAMLDDSSNGGAPPWTGRRTVATLQLGCDHLSWTLEGYRRGGTGTSWRMR